MQTAMAPIAVAAMCGQLAVVKHFLHLNDLDIRLPAVSLKAGSQSDANTSVVLRTHKLTLAYLASSKNILS